MKIKYDFSEIVRSSLDAGLKSLNASDEIRDAATAFGKAVVADLAKRFSVSLESRIEPMVSPEECVKAAAFWGETVGFPDSWTLSAYQPDTGKQIPLINYRVDPTCSYPCVIQNGAQNIFCSDIEKFKQGLSETFTARAMAIANEVRALSQTPELNGEKQVLCEEV